ncbi:hypothetical protein [Streptomyces sp. NBRC 110028]|uniref:hypothetical protein n=1 Tax=Streptomyces sp. NBRC 110028 TaxID=1621260 RepID=UPI0006E40CFD|nr:hypothetical protein [Streptomyces sp. NBRC 110028]
MNHENDTPGPEDPDRKADREPSRATPDGAGPDGAGPDGAVPDSAGPAGAGSGDAGDVSDARDVSGARDMDEQALRRMLHHAVDDLEPPPHSLEQLRRAVPARRARRRQALVGAVAAVVLGGAALPALVHVTSASNSSTDRPANAASSHRTPQEGDSGEHGEGSGGKDPDGPAGQARTGPDGDKGKGGEKGKDKPSKGAPDGVSGGTAPDPSSTLNATSPTCSRTQLGGSGGSAGAADAEGRIYGSFRVVNTSRQACVVEGGGTFGVAAQGGADPAKVFYVDHTTGDAASGLPDPATEPGSLILQPGQAYEVRFAWIPASGGGPSGCPGSGDGTPTANPSPNAADGPSDQPGSGDPSGSPGGGGGEQPAASVQVSYTPEAGEPAVGSVTLSGACAGTVYGTGLLASS